jgi:hypothetical protein
MTDHMAPHEWRTLYRLCKERGFSINEIAGRCQVENHHRKILHVGHYREARAFLEKEPMLGAKTLNTIARHRVLTAALSKRGFWMKEIGENSYRLEKCGDHRDVVFDGVTFEELIAWLDQQPMLDRGKPVAVLATGR